MNMPSRLLIVATCWLGLALSGCGSLLTSDRPATTTWWLEPLPPAGDAMAFPGGEDLSLEVTVVPGLDTDRIMTLSPDNQLSHLAGARWADNLPDVLDSVLRRSLQATRSDAWQIPGNCVEPVEGCQVRVEFREFFAVLDGQGTVKSTRISYTVDMQCGGRGQAIGSTRQTPVHLESKKDVVAAMQQGLNAFTRTLRTDLYNLANADEGGEP